MTPARTPLVALKSKAGELDALLRLRPEDPTEVIPLVELLDTVRTGERARVLPKLVKVGALMAGRGQPLWIDTRWLTPDSPLARMPGGPFPYLRAEIETELDKQRDLFTPDVAPAIPVIPEQANEDTLRALGMSLEPDEHDIAVRVRDHDIPPDDLIASVARMIRLTGSEGRRVHVIIDAEFVKSVSHHRADRIARLVRRLEHSMGPASTTVLSGSVPAMLGRTNAWQEPRHEESLWRAVRSSITHDVLFGDYGVVHPIPSTQGFASKHVTVKYTCPSGWLYLRQRFVDPGEDESTEGTRARTFRTMCRDLVSTDEFAGREFSWGDREMSAAAEGHGTGLGATTKPIAVATSHHLAYLAARAHVQRPRPAA